MKLKCLEPQILKDIFQIEDKPYSFRHKFRKEQQYQIYK